MIKEAIDKIVNRKDLSEAEAEEVMTEIMEGKALPTQIAAFITALRMKGETVPEITGCATVMRRMVTRINTRHKFLVDTCGTGGDKAHTFNISTISAFVASGAGVVIAKESLGIVLSDTKGIVKPLEDALKRYECQISDLEKSRLSAYVSLESQIKSLITTQEQLQRETGNLVTALRRPEVRGRWGEITLKRVVELAGMSGHCDYVEQVSVSTDEGVLRPDSPLDPS